MKLEKYIYEVNALVELSRADVARFIRWAKKDPDVACQTMTLPGGALHDLKERLKREKTFPCRIDVRTIERLIQVTDHKIERSRTRKERHAARAVFFMLGDIYEGIIGLYDPYS